jgi:hypothetical protein
MSDIGINLDGLIAFLVAAGLGLLLLCGIVAGSIFAAVKANKKQQKFRQQRFFPHLIGMLASLGCCLAIELALLLTDTSLPPRHIPVLLDNWALLWAVAVLGLWPFIVFSWRRLGAPA